MAAGSIVQSRYEDDTLKLLAPPKLAKVTLSKFLVSTLSTVVWCHGQLHGAPTSTILGMEPVPRALSLSKKALSSGAESRGSLGREVREPAGRGQEEGV